MLTSRDHASMRWTRVVTNRPSGPKPFGPDIKLNRRWLGMPVSLVLFVVTSLPLVVFLAASLSSMM
jgi:hypothetical protein